MCTLSGQENSLGVRPGGEVVLFGEESLQVRRVLGAEDGDVAPDADEADVAPVVSAVVAVPGAAT